MRTLSNEECSAWLSTRNIPVDPYHRQECPAPLYEQVQLPEAPVGRSAVARSIVFACEPFDAALLQFTDWQSFPEDHMAVVEAVRAAHGERRPLIQSPGHLFEPAERDVLIGMAALGMFYGWSAYIYFSHSTTAFFWEGEILDVWSSDDPVFDAIKDAFEDLHLPQTPRGEAH